MRSHTPAPFCISGSAVRKKRRKNRAEKVLKEIMAEQFLDLAKDMNYRIQKLGEPKESRRHIIV